MRALGNELGLVVLLALGMGGCDAAHDIDVEFDCNDLCNRYRDCYDSTYDSAACSVRCDEFANNDPAVPNECDTCLDTRSCAGAFACSGECYGLLP